MKTELVMVSLLLCVSPGQADEGCGPLSFFAAPCLEEEATAAPLAPPASPQPLFRQETVARDTPPVLLQMLQHSKARTLAQARQFVAQEQEKQRILLEVQQLIQQATQERQAKPNP